MDYSNDNSLENKYEKKKVDYTIDSHRDENHNEKDIDAILKMSLDNTIIELDDIANTIFNNLDQRIKSTGMPIANSLTASDIFEFNNMVLINFPPN